MAANYWTSTHHQNWTFTRSKLHQLRSSLDTNHAYVVSQYPLPDARLTSIFLRDQLQKLARRLPTRQPILSTTLLYLARYWLLRPIRSTNPYLLLATCFYLASKTEELPHHIRLVLTEAKNLWPEYIPGDVYRMGECEFEVISALRSQLIVFHGYNLVAELSGRGDTVPNASSGNGGGYSGGGLGVGMNMSNAFSSQQGGYGYGASQTQSNSASVQDPSEINGIGKRWSLKLTQEETSMAWCIVNDSYLTDLPLIYPPHIIAIMATFLAVVFQPTRAPGLNLHSIAGQQAQAQQPQQFPGGIQQIHALPPKPGSYTQPQQQQPSPQQQYYNASSLGGNRGIASAIRDSSTASQSAGSQSNNVSAGQTKTQSEKVEKMIAFLAESEIDIEKVIDATQEIVSLYEIWEGYSEKRVKEAIARFVRGRGLDK